MVNIFYTDTSPEVCAKNLDNVRIVKMVTETMQILCGAAINVQKKDVKFKPPYKSTQGQRNHPCVLWASSSLKNYKWLLKHFIYLEREYQARFPKRKNDHTQAYGHYAVMKDWFINNKGLFKHTEFTTPPAATNNEEFASYSRDIRTNYKIIMLHKWWLKDTRQPTWAPGYPPGWINDERLFKDMAKMSRMKDTKRFKPMVE